MKAQGCPQKNYCNIGGGCCNRNQEEGTIVHNKLTGTSKAINVNASSIRFTNKGCKEEELS